MKPSITVKETIGAVRLAEEALATMRSHPSVATYEKWTTLDVRALPIKPNAWVPEWLERFVKLSNEALFVCVRVLADAAHKHRWAVSLFNHWLAALEPYRQRMAAFHVWKNQIPSKARSAFLNALSP